MKSMSLLLLLVVVIMTPLPPVIYPAAASVILRYSPADTSVAIGDDARLAIMIDDTLDVRTIELWVEYDPAILSSIDGDPGQLFEETGALIFDGFEEDPPGHWHGYAVVIGAYSWCQGPGELYVWTFSGDALGNSDVLTANVRLFDPDAVLINDVTLPSTTITVYDPSITPVPEHGLQAPSLQLQPNPFNPRCELSFHAPAAGQAKIDVFDSRGRKLGTVWEGLIGQGQQSAVWEGRDLSGRSLPSGIYLFRLDGPAGTSAWTRGILLK